MILGQNTGKVLLVNPRSRYDYMIKRCIICSHNFKPVSGVQKVCSIDCHKEQDKRLGRTRYIDQKEKILKRCHDYYDRKKTNRNTKLCECGCGKVIPATTTHWKLARFVKGHQYRVKGFSNETLDRMRQAHLGKKVSEETKMKMSIARRGEKHPMYGKSCPWMKKLHQDATFEEKRMKAMNVKPNKIEDKIIKVIEKYRLPFKYVGNGSLFINRLNPDFVSTDGSQKVIEVFGDYWHSLDDRDNRSEKARKNLFREKEFDCLVLWEKDIVAKTEHDLAVLIMNFRG